MHTASLLIALTWAATRALAQVRFLGVAIAGGDFGCQINGQCPTGSAQLPLGRSGGGDGPGQMRHWASLSKPLNLFRLSVSWQFLSANKPDGSLDSGNLGRYDELVRACLATGAHCMIDMHNFARWDGKIIGQGGPTDEAFAAVWGALAARYASQDRVMFELMNEPHHLDVGVWAQTCQKAVTAIRAAGAARQVILLPGDNFDSAATLVSGGSADALMAIRNPDGTVDGLVLDVHKYMDEDNSGTHKTCTTDNVGALREVAEFLRRTGRKGLVSETGASRDATCMAAFCAQNTFINQNADVFLGLVGWGAGSFDTNYILSLTPSKQGQKLVDNKLMQQCLIDKWVAGGPPPPPPPPQPASPQPASPQPASPQPASPQPAGPPPGAKTTPMTTPAAGGPPNIGDGTYTVPGSMVTARPAGGGDEGLEMASGTPTPVETAPCLPTEPPATGPPPSGPPGSGGSGGGGGGGGGGGSGNSTAGVGPRPAQATAVSGVDAVSTISWLSIMAAVGAHLLV